MFIIKKSEDQVTIELPKITLNILQIENLIDTLKETRQSLIEYRQKRIEESTHSLWHDFF